MKNLLQFLLCSILSITTFQTAMSQLPTEISCTQAQLAADNLVIARQYAPFIHQMTDIGLTHSLNGRADLITAVTYDDPQGFPNTTDNWENLANFASGNPFNHDELDPIVYYSVVWTTKYWFVSYAFYHPRDYSGSNSPCCEGINFPTNFPGDNHENDLEGAIVVVTRDDFKAQGVATISHSDLLIYNLDPSFNGPELMIDNGTHAVEVPSGPFHSIQSFGNEICDDDIELFNPHITYSLGYGEPYVSANTNFGYLAGTGEYELEDIFGSDPNSLFNLKYHENVFAGSNIFRIAGNTECQQYGSDASAPWGWSQMTYDWSALNSLVFNLSLPSGSANVRVLHNPYYNECGEGVNYEYELFSGEEVSFVQLYSTFEIPPYKTLTIKDKELRMDANGQIILNEGSKLFLDNTKITNCTGSTLPSELWDGIFAVGKEGEIARVTMENGSTIDKSKYGITNTDGLALVNWESGYTPNDEGKLDVYVENSFFTDNDQCITIADGPTSKHGFIYIDDASFTNNLRGIGFFGKKLGSFVIKNSEFNETNQAISVASSTTVVDISDNKFYDSEFTTIEFDRSRNITFQRNVVEGCLSQALSSKDSYAKIIDNNHFNNNVNSIYCSGTFPNSASIQIGNGDTDANLIENTTSTNNAAIRIDGTTFPTGAEIINNKIINSNYAGIHLNGINISNVINNTVGNSETGFMASSNGINENTFKCNLFYNNEDQDMQIKGENSKSKFLENHFTGLPTFLSPNINLVSALVHPFQGTSTAPADNCYMENADADINVTGIQLPNSHFIYSYFEDAGIDNCEIPLTTGNYTPNPILSDGLPNCLQGIGSNFTSTFDPNGTALTPKFEHVEYCQCFTDSITHYADLLVLLGGDDPRTEQDETSARTEILLETEATLNFWIKAAIFYAINNEDYSYAINVLQPLLKWEWQANLYGLYILSGQYGIAETHLLGLPENNLDQTYFKEIQEINLKRWNSRVLPYHASQAELDILFSIALEETPSSGYASSLYYAFTGDIVPINISVPLVNQKRSVQESVKENWIYPNPSQGIFEIDPDLIQHVKYLKLINATGKVVFSKNNYNGLENGLDLSYLSVGVYFLEIGLTNNSTKRTKLVKI